MPWLDAALAGSGGAATLTCLGAALGAGLLIGLERERRKGRGPRRQAAGIRSFTLVALAGALAQLLGQPALVALGAAVVVVLAALAYRRSLGAGGGRPVDPGMTSELALFVTYLLGVLAIHQPALGAAAAVVVTALLAARGSLHHLATRLLSAQELHDGLLLAGLALVLLPLLPQQPVPWLAGLQPRTLAALVLLILMLQAAGHVALRLVGPGAGLALSGLLSGFVSSTATIGSLGARARAEPALTPACTAGAVLSTAATWLQGALLLGALAPALLGWLAPVVASGAVVALACGLGLAWRAIRQTGPAGPGPATGGGALRVREALLVAAVLTGVTAAVDAAGRHFGDSGALASVALSGLADAHAGMAAVAALQAAGRLDLPTAAAGVLLTLGSNSLTRVVTAALAGGWRFALPVGAALALAMAAALAVLAWRWG